MPRVAIVQPPLPLALTFIDYPYFAALGAYQAASVMRACGCEVSVIDGLSHGGLERRGDSAWLGERREQFLARVSEVDADAVVVPIAPFLSTAVARPWLAEVCAAVSGVGRQVVIADVVVGGMHYHEVDPGELLGDVPAADLLLRYECEPLLERFVRELGSRPSGVWENREPFALDRLPAPAFDLLDAPAFFDFLGRVLGSAWRPGPMAAAPRRTLPLVSARGCPYGCVFCTTSPGLAKRVVRVVPLERVRAWVADWVERFGLERLVILDEVVNLDADRFDGLLSIAEHHGLALELPNGLRADRLREDQVARLAARCPRIKVSLESGSRRVQDEVLNKRLDPAAVERVARWAHAANVPLDVHCMIGIPGETRAELRATLELAVDLHQRYDARPLLQYATPIPGTPLHQAAREQGWLVETDRDWSTGFRERGVLATETFDAELLEMARALLERCTRAPDARKVIVNLTYVCNNHCVFCAVGDREPRHAEVEPVLEALARYREEGCELLDIDGGEPTLHPSLLRVIASAKSLGYRRVTLVTNGRRSSYRDFARELARSGVDEVLVSLHAADAALAAELTSVADSLAQTRSGIANMLGELGSERVAVNTTVVSANVAVLRPLGDLLAALGVSRWNVQVVTPFGRARAEQRPTDDELERHLGDLVAAPPDGVTMQLINCPPCLVPGHEHVAAVDFGKAERDMVFVGETGENLQTFLAQRREHTERCAQCIWALVCPGEYRFEPQVMGTSSSAPKTAT